MMTQAVQTITPYQQISAEYLPFIEAALENYLPNKPPEQLTQAMRYGVLQGGKRFRPILVLTTGQLFDAKIEQLLPVACALEMIHAYSLIHDDMPCLDNDDLRRGRPTTHKQFGEALALLAGDALQAKAIEIISTPISGIAAENQLKLCLAFSQAIGLGAQNQLGLVNGQALDIISETSPECHNKSEETLLQIHQGKTAALLSFATQAGAILTHQPQPIVNLLGEFGHQLGILFQLVDDILDATSDTKTLGKTVGKDAAQNKLTFVSLYGLEKSQQILKDEQQKAMNLLKQLTSLSTDKTIETSPLKAIVDFLTHRCQ